MHPPDLPARLPLRRLALLGAVFGASLLSCGREITGPDQGIGTRYAHGLSFVTEFPGSFASVETGAGSVVPFTRVRVLFLRLDSSVALDRVVDFPAAEQELALDLSVPLSRGAPETGEPLRLYLRYINAAGDTVFSGGPVDVVAVPSRRGQQTQPAPVTVPVSYTGPGAEATTVDITPDTVWVTSGQGFAFTATAHDAQDAEVLAAPLVWTALDPTKATVNGLATGAGTTLPARGAARVRVALAAGGTGSGWADTAIVMIAPQPSTLTLVSGGNQTGPVLAPLPDSIVVRLTATDGQPMMGLPVAFAATSGGGSVSSDTLLTDVDGRVAVRWTLGSTAGDQTLTASASGVTDLQISATGEATAATQLTIVTQPVASATAGDTLPAIVAEVRTAANIKSPLYTDSVRIAITDGPAGGTLRGRSAVLAVDGTVTFDSLSFDRAGAYTLTVSAVGLSSAAATPFNVVAAAPDSLLVAAGGGQFQAPGSALANPIVVRVADAFGNPVAGRMVRAALPAGGSVTPDSTPTTAVGQASFNWTLANTPGTQTIQLTVSGTSVPTLNVTANDGAGPIIGTTVAPDNDTLTFVGETAPLAATSQDAALNVIIGTYTWTSLDDSVATVRTSGVVTAVKNGLARIVATEAGGTADTVTVRVLQKVSSVTITPGTREIYLGAGYTFTAQAVDGGGTPLAAQPPVAWSVQNEAVATVDTAGRVQGTGLGTTQLRALIGGVQGVAGVTIKTPITRIAVVRDSVGFVVSDTFTIAALQRTRSYRAVAYDTLDAVMAAVPFVFESSNPSVALPDSTGSATVRVKAVANGLTSIRATAQGVTGSASLRVQQQLAALDLTPNTVNIAPTGVQALTARGLDADGYFLPSVTGVTFTSLQPSIATVNATTGVVTGVSAGTALVTASKDSILADTVTVTVGTGVPAVISFGRDSLAIGRSGSQSVPIYLSKPSPSPVTVLLSVADTFAYFSQASVTISAGATSANATLNGRNAGLTTITALDGSGVPTYAGDTALLAVQANVRFTTTSYYVVATQQTSTQILLSDPAPPGGSYVSYQFGTPGRAEISPDPAFIPAGQLAANVVISALAGGNTTVTPVTVGATGQTATIFTYPASLDINSSLFRLGQGQQRGDIYVSVPSNIPQGLTIALASSDTSIIKVPSTVVIPPGSYYVYFEMLANGANKGSARIYATAPGWTTDSTLVEVTTPRVGICCNGNIQTTSPSTGFSVSARDSVGNQYTRVAPLVVSLASSDTSIVKLNQTTATIPAGSGSVSGMTYVPAGGAGTARIYATAPGHGTDSITVNVTGPKLSFNSTIYRLGRGQSYTSIYVSVPNNTTAPLLVTLARKQGGVVAMADTVYIPTGTYYRYFQLDGLATGSDTIYASAPGHQPDTAAVVVSSPRLGMSGLSTYDNFRPPFNINVSVGDSLGSQYPLLDTIAVSLSSSDTTVAKVSPTAMILPGGSSTNSPQITIVGVGSAVITVSAPGFASIADTLTVRVPKLSFSTFTYRIGRRQLSGASTFYVSVPNNVSDTLPVTITQTNPTAVSVVSSADIPSGTYYRYFGIAAPEIGVDTIIASAPNYEPDTMIVTVTSPRLSIGGIATPRTTTDPPRTFSVTTTDSVGNAHPSMDTLVISVASSNTSVMQVTQPTYRILPGAQTVSPQVSFVGPGTAFITVSDSAATGYLGGQTNTVTVTGPSLSIYNATPKLGMRQHNGDFSSYVSVPNNITGSPLTVYLTSSDPTAVSVPASVEIPVGTYYAYFRVTAHDAVATVQITATAVGYASANVNQQVTAPRFVINAPGSLRTTQSPGVITVYATDADGNQHATTENVIVSLASSDNSVASVDSTTVTILANTSVNNQARVRPHSVGTIQLSASDPRVDAWRYGTATSNFSVTTPSLSFDWTTISLGVGQYTLMNVSTSDYLRPPVLVTLTSKTGASAVPDTVTVDSGTYSRQFRLTGVSVGLDSIKGTGAGHHPDSAAVTVGLGNIAGILSWPTTMSTDTVQVTLRTKAPDGNIRNVAAATTFTLSVDANLKFVVGGAEVTSVTVPADQSQVTFRLVRVAPGIANVTISNANYTPFTAAVTVNAP